MNATITTEGEKTIVKLQGRLDTTNVKDFENQIESLFTMENPNIVMECTEFDYISSSGLRVLLSLQKSILNRKGKLILKDLKPEIKEVFDMTGFSSIFCIE